MHTEQQTARATGNLPGRNQKKTVSQNILPAKGQKSIPSEKSSVNIDIAETQRFLELLDPGGLWNFQTFIEKGKEPAPGKEARHYIYSSKKPETLDQAKSKLIAKNKMGACVSVCINECSEKRNNNNVSRIRALFVDVDDYRENHPFIVGPPFHCVIQTSEKAPTKRGFHGYLLVKDCTMGEFPKLQKALAEKFSPGKVDINPMAPSHAMRMPGFVSYKNKEPFQVKIVEFNNELDPLTPQQVIDYYDLLIEPDSPKTEGTDKAEDFSSEYLLHCIANNEQGDSWIFRRLMSGRYCYDSSSGLWYFWNGAYWEEDKLNGVGEAMAEVIRIYATEADRQAFYALKAGKEDDDKGKKEAQHNQNKFVQRIYNLQTMRRQQNVIKMSQRVGQEIGGLSIVGDEWDQNKYILPCRNGLVNTVTGEFRPGTQGDYIKTVCPTEWEGLDAKCPNWEKFMSQVLVDEHLQPCKDTLEYVQMILGMAITGDTAQHLFPIWWGDGQNGKGTAFKVLLHVLGPLAKKSDANLLIKPGRARDSAAPREDLMALRGTRLIWCNETNRGDKLDVSTIKELAGGDPITCRGLHGKPITFDPTYLVCLATNHKPVVPSKVDDPALWRRVVLIPFRLEFVDWDPVKPHERPMKKFLEESLKAEGPGILAWLVKGAMKWRAIDKFTLPANIRAATEEYKEEFDYLGMFIKARLITEKEYQETINHPDVIAKGIKPRDHYFSNEVQAKDLQDEYKDWCEEEGLRPMTNVKFGKEMQRRFDHYVKRFVFYKGIDLRSKHENLLQLLQTTANCCKGE